MVSHFLISGVVGRLIFEKNIEKYIFKWWAIFLFLEGWETWKLLTSGLKTEVALRGLKMHVSSWGPARVFFLFLEGWEGRFLA